MITIPFLRNYLDKIHYKIIHDTELEEKEETKELEKPSNRKDKPSLKDTKLKNEKVSIN